MNATTDGNLAALRQHQIEVDRAGDIEDAAERKEQECREILLSLGTCYGMDADEVMDCMFDLGETDIATAYAMLDSDPLEAVKILKEVRRKAVEDVLGRMDFEEIVILEAEQRGEAA